MGDTTQNAGGPRTPGFLFFGNAVAAGGFLTMRNGAPVQLDLQRRTTHGESSLPTIGGISHSLIEDPDPPFEDFIDYERVETTVEGTGDSRSKRINLRAAVSGVRVMTRPSPQDQAPFRSITFRAERLALSARSTHPAEDLASFELLDEPEIAGMSLVRTPLEGEPEVLPLRLEFDQRFLSPTTLDHLRDCQRTRHGNMVKGSIVSAIVINNKRIPGNELIERGFGKITFGA